MILLQSPTPPCSTCSSKHLLTLSNSMIAASLWRSSLFPNLCLVRPKSSAKSIGLLAISLMCFSFLVTHASLSSNFIPFFALSSPHFPETPSIRLWTCIFIHLKPDSSSGLSPNFFQCLNLIRALFRSEPVGLRLLQRGYILPRKSQYHACQNTFAL